MRQETTMHPHYRYYRNLALANAPHRDPITLVDVGCARGDFLASLPRRWRRIGVETNRRAIAAARQRHPYISFYQVGDAAVPVGHVDVVTAFDVLERVDDVHGALEIVHRALHEDGVFIMVVPTRAQSRSTEFWRDAVREHFDIVSLEGVPLESAIAIVARKRREASV